MPEEEKEGIEINKAIDIDGNGKPEIEWKLKIVSNRDLMLFIGGLIIGIGLAGVLPW